MNPILHLGVIKNKVATHDKLIKRGIDVGTCIIQVLSAK